MLFSGILCVDWAALNMRPVVDYQLVNLFSNRGTWPSGYTDFATGVGSSRVEAVQVALTRLASRGWDTRSLIPQIMENSEWTRTPHNAKQPPWCFISLYVR